MLERAVRALRPSRASWLCTLAAAAVVGAPDARADFTLSNVVFEVEATSSLGTGSFQVTQDMGTFIDDTFIWNMVVPAPIFDTNTQALIGSLDFGSVFYQGDPTAALGFSVTAGAADTQFVIRSGLLGFPTLDPAEGVISGGLTLSDSGSNGASLVGLGPGQQLALAQYNGLVPGGTTFFDLSGSMMTEPGGSGVLTFGTGFLPIGAPVNDISLQFSFGLSAGDHASGTASYTVIPAPCGLAVLGAGLLGRRRRRR